MPGQPRNLLLVKTIVHTASVFRSGQEERAKEKERERENDRL